MTERTPGPWKKKGQSVVDPVHGMTVAFCSETYGAGVQANGKVASYCIDAKAAKANAAFIALACNGHYGLLELAAEAMWRRDYPSGGSVYRTYDSLNLHDKERHRAEALALAATPGGSEMASERTVYMGRTMQGDTHIKTEVGGYVPLVTLEFRKTGCNFAVYLNEREASELGAMLTAAAATALLPQDGQGGAER